MSASDKDGDEITYSIATTDDRFAIDASTGQIDLVKSLDRESEQEVRLEVWATDDGNLHPVTNFLFIQKLFSCLCHLSFNVVEVAININLI